MVETIGRPYGFLFSVGAEQEIARLCPNEDLTQLRGVLTGKSAAALSTRVDMLCVLSKWHEKAKAREAGGDYEETPLTREELLLLTTAEYEQLLAEALSAMVRDQGRTVEAETGKKEKAPEST